MKNILLFALLYGLILIISCANFAQAVVSTDTIDPAAAYIYGRFVLTKGSSDKGQVAVALVNQQTEEKLIFKCLSEISQDAGISDDNTVYAVKAVPGTYKIDNVSIFDIFGNEIGNMSIEKISGKKSGINEFTAEPSSLYYIGDYIVFLRPRPDVRSSVVDFGNIEIYENYNETKKKIINKIPGLKNLTQFSVFE